MASIDYAKLCLPSAIRPLLRDSIEAYDQSYDVMWHVTHTAATKASRRREEVPECFARIDQISTQNGSVVQCR